MNFDWQPTGAVLRRSWRSDDEGHPAVLLQVFRPVL